MSAYGKPVVPVVVPSLIRFASPVVRHDGVLGVVLDPPSLTKPIALVQWAEFGLLSPHGTSIVPMESLSLALFDRTGMTHALWWLSNEVFGNRTRYTHMGNGVSWVVRNPCGLNHNGWDDIPGWILIDESVDGLWTFDASWVEDEPADGWVVAELSDLPAPRDLGISDLNLPFRNAARTPQSETGLQDYDLEALRIVVTHRLATAYGYGHVSVEDDTPPSCSEHDKTE